MTGEAKHRWIDKLRERWRARRERTAERQRHRSEHERALQRAGKAGGSQYFDSDIHGGGSG